ncbi:MAG: hypothetical protein IID03_09395 [Candidatus Dadabacteria bacterium]|nr:hypothetical protein [Candidatus Dadabacteria bacterium]
MLKIELTFNDFAYNEPPPNIVWYGKNEDFFSFLRIIYKLAMKNNQIVELSNSESIILINFDKLVLQSSSIGNKLVSISGNEVKTDLSCDCWKEILKMMLPVSLSKGFQYIDFDNDKFIEDANWIISSSTELIE